MQLQQKLQFIKKNGREKLKARLTHKHTHPQKRASMPSPALSETQPTNQPNYQPTSPKISTILNRLRAISSHSSGGATGRLIRLFTTYSISFHITPSHVGRCLVNPYWAKSFTAGVKCCFTRAMRFSPGEAAGAARRTARVPGVMSRTRGKGLRPGRSKTTPRLRPSISSRTRSCPLRMKTRIPRGFPRWCCRGLTTLGAVPAPAAASRPRGCRRLPAAVGMTMRTTSRGRALPTSSAQPP